MFCEDVVVQPGETVSGLGEAYGYKASEWKKIWDHPANAGLKGLRKEPEKLGIGDILWIEIPWMVTESTLIAQPDGGLMTAKRDGEPGTRLTWVQTVYRHNQPIGPNPDPFCVDGCTPDDDLPFYWTNAELKTKPERRNNFRDYSHRYLPTVAQGTTKWRAIVSVGAVTGLRVTVWDSQVWGWDLTPSGSVSILGPRDATPHEISGHLNLLRKGKGTGPLTFGKAGWTFRKAAT